MSRKEQVAGLQEQLDNARNRRTNLQNRGYNGFVYACLGQHINDLQDEINNLNEGSTE